MHTKIENIHIDKKNNIDGRLTVLQLKIGASQLLKQEKVSSTPTESYV